mmetsp:Transcript_9451/g.17762  ORF Transcript_9451/g.17762 Transcript_9451/m.17762 type:complete len:90 (+) Transcript_9451:186-455(+)
MHRLTIDYRRLTTNRRQSTAIRRPKTMKKQKTKHRNPVHCSSAAADEDLSNGFAALCASWVGRGALTPQTHHICLFDHLTRQQPHYSQT